MTLFTFTCEECGHINNRDMDYIYPHEHICVYCGSNNLGRIEKSFTEVYYGT